MRRAAPCRNVPVTFTLDGTGEAVAIRVQSKSPPQSDGGAGVLAWSDVEVASAGLAPDADTPLTSDLVEWADIIFVMEAAAVPKLASKFKDSLNGQRVVCLNVPDRYEFMDPALVRLLSERVPKFLGSAGAI